ncbi:MAG: 4Fe-4S binding protein [Deltaproteobacteria bacterium]|nr:4Fe-4S binding protein [Deltaproteobacteria bacterium]
MFRWMRRGYQLVFLALFFYLVLVTTASLIGGTPVWWFLAFDPLVALATALASRSLYHHLLWALPLIVVTLVFGRWFCGWICPLGVLHHAIGWAARPRKAAQRLELNRWRRLYQTKYLVLLAMLGAAALGSTQIGLLDPIAFTWRALATSIVPAIDNSAFGLYQGERHFHASTLIAALFAVALALNLWLPRLFCRMFCPLGALLGLMSKLSLFRLVREPSVCKDCNLCGVDCAGAAEPHGTLRATECLLCMNCVYGCPRSGISYRFLPAPDLVTDRLDLGRRRWVMAAVAGAAAVPLARASDGVEPRPHPLRVRPPGAAAEQEFLARCIKCGACMKVCPTAALQPALHEAGLEGLWSPILVARLGYCEQACVLCGQVCPTGAIRHLTVSEKVGQPPHQEPVRIGTAFIDRGRCLPWAMDTECIVCEEVCPTSPKAIHFKLAEVVTRDGSTRQLKQPYVDPTRCWGCGVCETRCPVSDQAAIRITSVGESRDPRNRLLLGRDKV